jgi:hypothetical protein
VSKTHNQLTSLVVDVLLQRRLTQMLGKVIAGTLRTNLVIHHGVTDIFRHVAKLIRILGAVQEPRDIASLCQWGEVLKNVIEFPNNPYTSDWLSMLDNVGLPFEGHPPLFLLDLTLRNGRT